MRYLYIPAAPKTDIMKTEESFLTNLTKLYVLVALYKSPKHGYELMADFKKVTGKNMSAGQIYPLLSDMEKKSFVTVSEQFEGNRKKKVYSLTEKGKKHRNVLISQLGDLLAYGGVKINKE